ncbi:MAG: hypothetical protein K2J77_09480 [Oscillospiraceae bacterium]|nr:hypothetical protein [Oscillospiraceae bacterium]
MKKAKIFLSAALAVAVVCSAAYAAAAVDNDSSVVESEDTSETSGASNSKEPSNYLNLNMSGGKADIDFRDGDAICKYPDVHQSTHFAIDIGLSGTITIDRPGYNIIAVKIGSSTAKRDMTKVSDTVYGSTVQEGDTDINVIFEGDNSEAESSAPAPSTPKPAPTTPTRPTYHERDDYDEPTTHESVPEADTNPDTGIALAAAPAALAAVVVIVAAKKKK